MDTFSPEVVIHALSMGMCAVLFVMHTLKFFRDRQVVNQQNEDAQTETEIVVQQKEFNEKLCSRCCANFSGTNRKYLCETCGCNVCKTCAQWNDDSQSWICKYCSSRDSSPSPEWLQKKLLDRCRVFESAKKLKNLLKVSEEYERDNENDSGYHPSMSVTSEGSGFGEPAADPAILEVHEHVEAIVEQLLGDSIDNTTLDPLCRHPEYDRMMEIYHVRLRDALAQLIQSLQMAIKNHPLSDDETPTASHSTLKYVINEIVEEAKELPYLMGSEGDSMTPQSPFGPQRSDVEEDDLDEKSYEEILAIAILNKVIQQRQTEKQQTIQWTHEDFRRAKEGVPKPNSTRRMSNKEIQTDLNVDSESDINKRSVNRIIHSSPTMEFSEDESSFGTESAGEDFSWAHGITERSPTVDYVVEEQIEEITTTVENSSDYDEDLSRKDQGVSSRLRQRGPTNRPLVTRFLVGGNDHAVLKYNGMNIEYAESLKVPFPEFGMDVVSGEDDENVDQDFTTYLSVIENWEDNWLFRKKKTISPFINLGNLVIGDEPVSMLVPNPSDDVKATVGNRSIDELSDMSEMNSEGSIEFSSSNSDHEEDEAEDEEYEVEAGSEVISEEMNKAAKNEMKNLKPDMASWALNSMLEHQFSKISSKPECVKSTVENVGNSLQQDVVDKRIVLDAYFNNTCCQSNVSEDHLADGDAVSQRLHIPIPAPRKSKSSVCSEEIHFTTSSKLSVPRFVPPASRCLDDAGIKFVQIPRNTLIPAGRVATVKCRVSATQPYNVAWYFGTELLEKSESIHMYSYEGDIHCLEIYDTSDIYSGKYSCVAYDDLGQIWADFKITVYGTCTKLIRPEIKRHLVNVTVEENETIVLHCKANGIPEPRLLWFKDSKQIRLDKRFTLDRKSEGEWILTVHQTCIQDTGDYKVVAKNQGGEASSVSRVVVVPCGSSHVLALTERTNQTQEAVYYEAEDMVNSANKESMANAIRETNGQTLDLIVRAASEAKRRLQTGSKYQSSTNESDVNQFIPDAIPGSIAERERQKWRNAVDMPNNPYTLENISKRTKKNSGQLMKEAGFLNGQPLNLAEDHVVRVKDGSVTVDCGLKVVDPSKYRRDYYVNNGPNNRKYPERPVSLPLDRKNEVELNNIEEKVYVSTAKILSLEDKINNIESQVSNINNETSAAKVNNLEDKVAHAVAQVAQSEKQVSKVEKEVARLQREICYRQNKQSDQECLTSDGYVDEGHSDKAVRPKNFDTSPSVRALASKFDGPTFKHGVFQNGSFEHKEDGTTIVRIDTKKPSPAPRSRMSESHVPSRSSPGPNESSNASFSSLTSINSSKNCAEIKSEVFAGVHSDIVESPEIGSEDSLERSPSVKQLSQMFVEESIGEGTTPSSPVEVSVRRVHSLTARSLSKEFREATQRNKPRQLNKNISVCNDQDVGVHKQCSNHQLESSEELSSYDSVQNGSNNRRSGSMIFPAEEPSNCGSEEAVGALRYSSTSVCLQKTKPAKKLSSSIKNRAAFWDRRVEEDRMTDQSMADQFPPMESPLYNTSNEM